MRFLPEIRLPPAARLLEADSKSRRAGGEPDFHQKSRSDQRWGEILSWFSLTEGQKCFIQAIWRQVLTGKPRILGRWGNRGKFTDRFPGGKVKGLEAMERDAGPGMESSDTSFLHALALFVPPV